MAEGRSVSGRQASRVDWIRFRVTAVTLGSCRMEWEIGGGGEARVAVGRSYTHAEHGKVGTNGKGREGRRKKEAVGRDGGELEGSSKRRGQKRRGA